MAETPAPGKAHRPGNQLRYDSNLPLDEDHYLRGEPIESLYAYGQSKRMMYIGMLMMAKQYKMKHLHFIPSTLYGPSYHTDGRQMHSFSTHPQNPHRQAPQPAGCPSGVMAIICRESACLDDFVEIVLRLDEKVENQTINIGAGEESHHPTISPN